MIIAFMLLCGLFGVTILIAFISVFMFMSDEDWDELNKYYEKKENNSREFRNDNIGGPGNSIYQNNFGSNWPNTF